MTRYSFGLMCVLALGFLPMVGCGEANGTGGNGGSAGMGGMAGEGGNGSSGGGSGASAGMAGNGGTGGIPENDLTIAARAYCGKLGQCFFISAESCIDGLRLVADTSLDPNSGCAAAFVNYFECIAGQDFCDDLSACDMGVINEACN